MQYKQKQFYIGTYHWSLVSRSCFSSAPILGTVAAEVLRDFEGVISESKPQAVEVVDLGIIDLSFHELLDVLVRGPLLHRLQQSATISSTPEEHLEHVRKVLEVLRAKKLYAKGSKCDFFREEVQFLGFRVGDGRIDKDPAKIESVCNWPAPTTIREVRGFLGLVSFYRKFIKDFAILARPLTDILKSTEFEE
eukprot:857056-Rhodomonas_salina.3